MKLSLNSALSSGLLLLLCNRLKALASHRVVQQTRSSRDTASNLLITLSWRAMTAASALLFD
uniref:Uncharacterized protein n=1 Tax=Arundo donax TaxID=35708 RepID=A0A0A9G893_ARUDO